MSPRFFVLAQGTPVEAPPPGEPPDTLIWQDALDRAVAKGSGDANWIAVMADANALAAKTVTGFGTGTTTTATHIGYGFGGADWYVALTTLSLAYHLTGNTTYSSKVLQIIDVLNGELGNLTGQGPLSFDDGYPSRHVAAGAAVAYSWCGGQFSAGQRDGLFDVINEAYDWHKTLSETPNGPSFSNYFGGHLLGYGLFGEATRGINPRGDEIADAMRAKFDDVIVASFVDGIFQGGWPCEGHTYGTNHLARVLQYAVAIGGDVRVLAGKIIRNLIYQRKPDRWKLPDEADWAGEYTGIMSQEVPTFLCGVSSGLDQGYIKHFLDTFNGSAPVAIPASAGTKLMWLPSSLTAVDYTTRLPRVSDSRGDERLTARSDWTDSAVWVSFAANGRHLDSDDALGSHGHGLRNAGHIGVQRGTDHLLLNSGSFRGPLGYEGNPTSGENSAHTVQRSWRANTLWPNTLWGSGYTGGQGFWGIESILADKVTEDYCYKVADLTRAYRDSTNSSSIGDATLYRRAVVVLADGTTIVWDKVTGSTDPKKVVWHSHPNAWTVASGRATAAVGASKAVLDIITPVSGTFTKVDNPKTGDEVSFPIHTTRVEASSNEDTTIFLTTIQPIASGATALTPSAIANGVTIGTTSVTFDATSGTPTVLVSGDPGVPAVVNPPTSGNKVIYMISPVAGEHFVTGELRLIAAATIQAGAAADSVVFIDETGATLGTVLVADADFYIFQTRLTADLAPGIHYIRARATFSDATVIDTPAVRIVVDATPSYGSTVNLVANTTVTNLIGTANSRIRVNGNGFAYTGTAANVTWQYVDFVNMGGTDFTSTTSLTIDHCKFDSCNIQTIASSGTTTIEHNDFCSNSKVLLGQFPDEFGGADSSFPAVILKTGQSASAKIFRFNRMGAGWVKFDNTRTWDVADNILIGPRVGLEITSSSSAITRRRNYVHHIYYGGWSQGNLFESGGVGGILDEHNILIQSSWPVRQHNGIFRYNLILDHGHWGLNWSNGSADAEAYRNLIIAGENSTDAAAFYKLYAGTATAHHNTIDGLNSISHAFLQDAGTLTATWNLASRVDTAMFTTRGGTLIQSNNLWWSVAQEWTDPVPIVSGNTAIVFDERAVWERMRSLEDILAEYRDRYTPVDPEDRVYGAIGDGSDDDLFGVIS